VVIVDGVRLIVNERPRDTREVTVIVDANADIRLA
jgi:uridine kinase